MAVSGSIGDLFVVTVDNTTSATTATTAQIPRGFTVEYITFTCTATAGAGTAQFFSSPDNSAFNDMFGGAVNIEINNVTLVAQATGAGAGTMMLVPTANANANVAQGATGAVRITVAGNNHSYLARFYCSAYSPTALTVTEV
jgi:hypothetical protein